MVFVGKTASTFNRGGVYMNTNSLLIISDILFGIIDIILVIKLIFKLYELKKADIRIGRKYIFFEKGAVARIIFQGWSIVYALALYHMGKEIGSIYLTNEEEHLLYVLVCVLALWYLLSFKAVIIFANGVIIRCIYYEKKDVFCQVQKNNVTITVGEKKYILNISKYSMKKINIFMVQNGFNLEKNIS